MMTYGDAERLLCNQCIHHAYCMIHDEECEPMKRLKQPQWIPCSERFPEDNEEVLISAYGVCQIARLVGRYWLYDGSSLDREAVDAWMPLPQPYMEGDKEWNV